MQLSGEKPVLLFDGVCNLCTGSVQFIIKNDPGGKIQFASLQSPAGAKILSSFHLPQNQLSSLVLIEKGEVYTRSTGALRVARYLSAPWPLLYTLIIIPAFIRNAVYDWIGRHRYKWFGQKNECWLPTQELMQRFIN